MSAEIRSVEIIDAERPVLRIDEREVKVRLIGVDARTPTRLGCSTDDESISELLAGGRLGIEPDSRAKDDAGLTWVWLWAGDELIDAALLRSGAATLARYWPNQRNEAALLRAQLEAARGHRGLWGRCRLSITSSVWTRPADLAIPRTRGTASPRSRPIWIATRSDPRTS